MTTGQFDRWSLVLQIHCRIHIVYIFLIQFFPQELDSFPEPLEVDNFPLPQEFDHIVHIRIIGKPQNVVISGSCLLLCCYLICTT